MAHADLGVEALLRHHQHVGAAHHLGQIPGPRVADRHRGVALEQQVGTDLGELRILADAGAGLVAEGVRTTRAACALAERGVAVTVVEVGERILSGFDAELAARVERLEELVGAEVGLVSTGPDREQTVIRATSALASWFA